MKTQTCNRKVINFSFFTKFLLVLTLAFATSCETEEFIESTESDVKDETSLEKATPVSGRIYTIRNKKSGRTLAVSGGSNSNRANVYVFGSNSNTSVTSRQWEVLNTSNGFVRLRGVDSRKSLEVGGRSNDNNANVQQFEYVGITHQQWRIISVGDGYFRLENRASGKVLRASGTENSSNAHQFNYRGWDSQKWFFTEIGGGGNNGGGDDDDDDGGGNGGSTADAIIGNGWKLNGFSGTLRVGNDDNGLDYADDARTNESHYFFENNGYATFRCYPGSPTSGGSSNPRSELREQIGGGDNFWDGTNGSEDSMKWRVRIEDLPPSGKLCFGQIHERDDDFDDIIRVQVEGDEGQNSGDITLRILGYVTEELEGSGRSIDFDMRMDTEYYFELTMVNSVVRLYELNNSGNRVRTLYTSRNVGDADQNYFKAGSYLQSTRSSHADSNVYGQVAIRSLSVSH